MAKIDCVVILVIMIFFSSSVCAEQKIPEKRDVDVCENCHGMPPLEMPTEVKFYEGAHRVHKDIDCAECHSVPSTSKHNNGIIDISPDLNYDHGSQVPYPGGGGGSCGGDNNSPMPSGCHGDKKEMKCFWMPGNVCKPVSAP